MNSGKLAWLQVLRGVAAILVVFVHARYFLFWTPSQGLANALFRPGAMGVDLFFLISGFIMVLTTAQTKGSARDVGVFLAKRLARIWPVYAVLALIGVQVAGTMRLADPVRLAEFGKSLLFMPVAPFSPPYYGLPYGLGWTLNFEAYFYLVFGLSMLAGRYRWLAFFGWLLMTLVVLPVATVGAASLRVDHDYHFAVAYLNQAANPIIWVFAAGVVAGLLYRSALSLPDCLATRCLNATLIAFALWWSYSEVSIIHGITEWGGPLSVAFLVFALSSKQMKLGAPPRALLWLGEVSFSLYLVHPIAQGATARVLDAWNRHDLTQNWSFVFLTTALSLVLAAISHSVLEQGLAAWVKRRLLGSPHARRTAKPGWAQT